MPVLYAESVKTTAEAEAGSEGATLSYLSATLNSPVLFRPLFSPLLRSRLSVEHEWWDHKRAHSRVLETLELNVADAVHSLQLQLVSWRLFSPFLPPSPLSPFPAVGLIYVEIVLSFTLGRSRCAAPLSPIGPSPWSLAPADDVPRLAAPAHKAA